MSKFKVMCKDRKETYVLERHVDASEVESILNVLNALADEGEIYFKEREEENG